MRFSRKEQETIINFNSLDNTGSIYTRMASVIRHLDRMGAKVLREDKNPNGKTYAKEYQVPVRWIRLPRPPRQVSDDLKEQMRVRFAKARDARTKR